MKLPKQVQRLKERLEPIVRDFEWTWTAAVVFSLGIIFYLLISMAVRSEEHTSELQSH